MRMKSDNSPSRSFRPWLYGMATVLVAAVIAQTALVSPRDTASQSANVTATPTPTPTATVIHTVAPEPISILGGGVTVRGSASLDWNDAPRATSYELRMLLNGVWTTLPANGVGVTFSFGSGELSSPGARVTGLPNYDFYHFSVRSVNSVGTSRWSPTLKVQNIPPEVATPTPTPTLTATPTRNTIPTPTPTPTATAASTECWTWDSIAATATPTPTQIGNPATSGTGQTPQNQICSYPKLGGYLERDAYEARARMLVALAAKTFLNKLSLYT